MVEGLFSIHCGAEVKLFFTNTNYTIVYPHFQKALRSLAQQG